MKIRAILLVAASLSTLSGCGFFRGLADPSAMWAASEPTPMSVVIRRAETARGVADGVDAMIGDTPVGKKTGERMALSGEDAQKTLEKAAGAPIYASAAEPLRVVPAEAWLDDLSAACADGDGKKTLIELLGKKTAKAYEKVASQADEVAELKAKIAAAEQKRDADDASADDKDYYQKKIDKTKDKLAKLEESYEPAVKELLASVRSAAADASDERKAIMTPIVQNLRQAVNDARSANAAASIRYPLALPGVKDDIKVAAKRFLADVIEEQTGHRPSLEGFSPKVELDGFTPKLSLNGIPPEALGDLQPGAIVKETTTRTLRYAKLALTLIAYLDENELRLGLQKDLLAAWAEGLGASEPTNEVKDLKVASSPGERAKKAKGRPGKRSIGGLTPSSCTQDGATASNDEEEPAKEAPKPKPVKAAAKPAKAKAPPKPAKVDSDEDAGES